MQRSLSLNVPAPGLADSFYTDRNQSSSGLEHLIKAADEQQRRSLRLFHTLQRVAEVEAGKQLAQEEAAIRRETKLAEIAEVNRQEAILRAQAAELARARRAERFEAAVQEAERKRQAALDTCNSVEERAAVFALEKELIAARNAEKATQAEAHRASTYRANIEILEERRNHILAKIDAATELSRQKEELHKVEMEIKAEEDYLNQQARDATKRRAELELEMRTSTFLAKSAEKERTLRKRLKELAALREAKQREAQERFEYVELQAQEAAAKDGMEREQLRRRLDEKKDRVEALCAERAALTEQLARVRHSMSMQEGIVRHSIDMLRRSGTSFSLPHDIARSLTEFGTASFFPRASLALPASRSGGAIQSASTSTSPTAASTHSKRVRPLSAAAAALRASRGGDGLEGHALSSRARPGANENQMKHEREGEGSRREDELRHVLRVEIDKEAERQAILAGTKDAAEIARLQRTFAREREESKRRILALSTAVNSGAASESLPRQMRPSANQ
uniref:Uncharacterized protein n=1 Tax=Dunaliella tertiolecta TaxID=3047 RepID=A0A7S3QSG6_DUNTE|mmetsp:Transcript_26144/g.70771  ORF Transcript_26144/g.70771 Transcript_26144/m.70771 type:complete len:511 (-) Transcript_26144:22-1554(-)